MRRAFYVEVKVEVLEQAIEAIRHTEDCHLSGWHVTPESSCAYLTSSLLSDRKCPGCSCGAGPAIESLRAAVQGSGEGK